MPEALIATTAPASKVNLLGMTRAQLESFFTEIGEKRFRAQQVMKWIHHHNPDLVVFAEDGRTEKERIDLQGLTAERLEKLLEEKGFKRR